jgi:putative tryptophan/tyrosine transport system substrate-binding protein
MKPAGLRHATLLAAALLWVGLAASPASAEQSGKTQRVGLLCPSVSVTRCRNNNAVQAFLKALRDLGYDEHRNFAIEFRSAEGSLDRLPELAAELVGLKVDVLIAPVCGAPLNAARQATSVIPIVVATCNDDMVRTGIVASLAHPGGNVTI